MKVYRTAIAFRTHWTKPYDFAVMGVEMCCLRGLEKSGWALPKRGQGLVLCFSKTKPSGNFSKSKFIAGRSGILNNPPGSIKQAPLRGQPEPFNYTLPHYVALFLKRKHLAPPAGQTRVLFWWPEYVTL